MSYDGSSDGGPKGTFENYRAEADVMFKQREYLKAIDRYNTALELRPNDVGCLIARSKCYQELGDLDKALKDSDEVLKEEANHVKGILQKAEVLYSMGDFETALMFFHRGKKIRPEIREFTLGVQKSSSAIENAVGPESGVKLRSSGDLSYFYEAQEQKQTKKKGYSKPGGRKEEKKEKARSAKQDPKTVKELLGELYADREYLDNLWKEIDENGAKTQTNEEIKELALEGLRYLDNRSEFWQQQKPMYSRKRDREMREGTKRRANSAGGTKRERTQWVIQKLEEIDDAQVQGEYERSLKLARKVLRDVENWTDSDLHNKPEMVATLHSSMGNAYLELGQYEKALKEHNKDLEIAEAENLEDAKSRAYDNIGRVYARMSKYEDAVEVWENKLPMAKSALEKTWLYHEVGRCYLEMGEYEKAEEYGEKSLAAAQEAEDEVWQLNATVLIAQSQVKCGELEASIDTFEKALDMARLQGDKQAENAIKKALDEVNKKIVRGIKDEENAGDNKVSPGDGDGDAMSDTDKQATDWTVRIYTSDEMGAGTDANVYITIYGQLGNEGIRKSSKITLDNKDNNFESGKCDEFPIKTFNFDKVTKVVIGHDNSGMSAAWHLNKVELENKESQKVYEFVCDRWLADDKEDNKTEVELRGDSSDNKKNDDSDGKRSPSPAGSQKSGRESPKQSDGKDEKCKWTVTVYTTDMKGAGTDANVYLIIYGSVKDKDNEQSEKINLDNKDNNFESGRIDTFEVETLNFDKVDKIRIGHDNSGLASGWHLDKVELKNQSTNKTFVFHCDRWLDDDEDDHAIERELTEGAKTKSNDPVEWIVKVYTSDKLGAGTDANVYLELFGKFDGKDDVASDRIILDNKGNNFESGKCDEFPIETYDYDRVDKILIGHDNSGGFAGWHLHKVELQNKKSKRMYTFICDKWLDDDKDDKKTERMLTAEKENKTSKSKGKQGDGKKDTKGLSDNKQKPNEKAKGQNKAHSQANKGKDKSDSNKTKGKDNSQANKAKGQSKDKSSTSKGKEHNKGKKGAK